MENWRLGRQHRLDSSFHAALGNQEPLAKSTSDRDKPLDKSTVNAGKTTREVHHSP